MRSAIEELALYHLWVIYPGQHRYQVEENISVWPLRDVAAFPEALDASRHRRRGPAAKRGLARS